MIKQNGIFDAQRGKKALMPYVNSEGPDECAHPCSLIRTFCVRRHIQLTLVISTSLISNNRLSRSENLVPA